jgi:hypothetical protein
LAAACGNNPIEMPTLHCRMSALATPCAAAAFGVAAVISKTTKKTS